MTPHGYWLSYLVMFPLITIPLKPPNLVKASLPPLSNAATDTPLCQEDCTCDSLYQLVHCTSLGLLSIPYDTIRNNTRVLRLPGNSISSLHGDSLRRFRQLRLLDLVDNQIAHISDDTFENQPKLVELDLSGNRLSSLPVAALAQLKSLRTLLLERNNITFLGPKSFANLTKLQNLSLSYNGLQVIDPAGLVGLVSLRTLSLDDNFLLEIPRGSLRDCGRLDRLSASANRIGTFVNNSEVLAEFSVRPWFEPAVPSRLRTLILSNNFIDIFSTSCFRGMTELADLDLSSNYILELPVDLFEDLRRLETLRISKNSPLYTLPSGLFRNTVNLAKLKARHCQLVYLPGDLFYNTTFLEILDLTGNGLSNTSFVSPNLYSLTKLFLGSNDIASIPRQGLSGLSNLEVLDLSSNHLTRLPILNSLVALEILDISENDVSKLEDHAFSGTSITFLNLRANNLQNIKESTIRSLPNASMPTIQLEENPWACDCRLKWTLNFPYKGHIFFSDIIQCVWPRIFAESDSIFSGEMKGGNLICSSYPKRENVYLLVGTWLAVVLALTMIFWAAAFHHARRRFRARQPRERFSLFKNANETNMGSTSTTGHSKVRFKALDSETESLEDDETTV